MERGPVWLLLLLVCICKAHAEDELQVWVDAVNGVDEPGCGLRDDIPCQSIAYAEGAYPTNFLALLLYPGEYSGDDAGLSFTGDSFRAYAMEGGVTISCTGPSLPSGWAVSARSAFSLTGMTFEGCDSAVSVLGSPTTTTISSCTFRRNSQTLSLTAGAVVQVSNCTFEDNTVSNNGNGGVSMISVRDLGTTTYKAIHITKTRFRNNIIANTRLDNGMLINVAASTSLVSLHVSFCEFNTNFPMSVWTQKSSLISFNGEFAVFDQCDFIDTGEANLRGRASMPTSAAQSSVQDQLYSLIEVQYPCRRAIFNTCSFGPLVARAGGMSLIRNLSVKGSGAVIDLVDVVIRDTQFSGTGAGSSEAAVFSLAHSSMTASKLRVSNCTVPGTFADLDSSEFALWDSAFANNQFITRPLWTEAKQSSNVTIGTTLFQDNSFRGSSFVVASERTTISYSRFMGNQVEALGLARDVFLLNATGTEITGVKWLGNDGSITVNGAVLVACTFQENLGSIYVLGETSILKECVFEGNTASDAALVCGCGACAVSASQFFDNLNTGTNGGAVRGLLCANDANCTDGTNCANASNSLSSSFASCDFGGNTAEIGVGASAEFSHDASFVECTFKNESSGSTGGYRGALAAVGDAWSPSAPIVCEPNYFSFQGVKIEVEDCTFEWTTALGAAILHKTTERPVYPYTDIVLIVSTLDYCGDAMKTGGDEDKFSWEIVQDEGVLGLLPELSLKYFSQGSYLLTGNATSQGVFTVFVSLFGENIMGSPKGFEVRPSEWYVSTTGQDTGNCGLGSSPCQTVAFTASLALPGDVIFVDPGIYYVSSLPAVVLRENVKLMATDATATTFRFDGASGAVLRLSSGATLSGFVVEGGVDHFVEFTGDFGSIINCTFVENHSANQALIQGPVEVPLQSGAPNMIIQDCVFTHNTGDAAILMIRRHTLQMFRNEVSNNPRPLAEVGGVSLGQLLIEHSNISVSDIGTTACVLLQSGSGLLVDNSAVSGASGVAAGSFVLVTPFEPGALFHIDVLDSSFENLTLQSFFAINVDNGRYGIKITNSSFQRITVEDSLIHALNADIEVQNVNFKSIFHEQNRIFGVPSAALIDLQGAANSLSIVNCTVNSTMGPELKPNVRATISDCGYIEIIDTTFVDNERGVTGMVSIDVFDGGCTQRGQNIVLVENSKFGFTRRDSDAGILSLNGNASQPVTAVVSNSLFEHCSGSYLVGFGAAIRANPAWNVELYGCNITDCTANVGVLYLAGPRNIVERCRIEDCHVNEVGGYQGAIITFPSMLFHRNYAAQCVLQTNGTQIIANVNGSVATVTVIDSVFTGNDAIIARSSIVTNETNFHSIYEAGKWPTAVLTAADYCGALEENPNLWFWEVNATKLDSKGQTSELQRTEWTSTAVVVSRSDGTVELDWGDWKPVVSGHYALSITEIGGTVIAYLEFEVVAAAMDTVLSGTYGEPRIRYCPVTSVSIDVKVVDRFLNPSLIEDRSVECIVHGADNSTLSLNASYVADGMFRASFDYTEERETVSDMIMLLVQSFVDGVVVGAPYNQRLYPTSIVARDSLLTDFHEESIPRVSSFQIEAVNEDHELVPCDEYEQCLEVVMEPQGLTRRECNSPVVPRGSCKMGVTEVTVNTTCAGEYEVIAMIGSVVVGEGRNTWSMTISPGLPQANTTVAWLDTNEPIANETFHVIVNVNDAYSNRHPCPIPTLTAQLVQVATTELTPQPCTNLHETKFAAVVPKQGPFTIQIAIEGTPVFSIEETAYLGSTCLPGTYGAGGVSPCEPCRSGSYCPSLGCIECISCPEHAGSVPNSNRTSLESCRCASGYYGVDECTKCDEACYGCEEPCVGGEQCAAPFSGEYCMSCATGDDCDHCDPYFMLVSQCYKCPNTTGIVALDIAVMIAMILMAAVATVRFQNSLAWSTLLMYMSFMQSVSVVLFSYVPWPRLLRNVLLATTVSIFNSELFALRCAGVQQSLWFIVVFSIAVLQFVLVIKAGLAHVRSRMSAIFDDELGELTKDSDSATEDFVSSGRPLEEFTSQAPQRARDTRFPKAPLAVYLQSTVCAMLFCLVPLTNVISLAVQCRETPGGDLVLSTHPDVECFSSEWAILFISGAVAAAGIVFTIVVVSWLLFYHRKRHVQAVSFMHCMYKPEKFYWILIVKLREILFALAVVAMPTMILQLISGAVVLVAGLVLLVMYQPHKSRTLSAVDGTLMVLQLAMLGTGSLLQIDQQSATVAIIVMSLVGLWMGVSVLVTWGVCWPHIISRSQKLWTRLTQRAQFTFSPMQALFADEDDVTESWRINPADLELVHPPIAKGANGVVYRAKYKGANVAVKTVVRSGSEEDLDATLEEFKREIRNLCRIHHPNVLLMIGACLENWSLVVEFCERGSFFDVLKRNFRSREEVKRGDLLTPVRLLSVLRGAARGMSYLHAQVPPMIHRDLKSLNILVTEGWQSKVADFGQSKRRFESQAVLTKQYIGTTRWAAPELLAGNDYGEEADVYSFGVVLWEGMSGQIPFEDDMWESRLAERVIAGARPEIPAHCSVSVVALIEACWHMDPLVRPSFQSICDTLDNMQPHEFARAGSDEGEDGDSERLSLHLLE